MQYVWKLAQNLADEVRLALGYTFLASIGLLLFVGAVIGEVPFGLFVLVTRPADDRSLWQHWRARSLLRLWWSCLGCWLFSGNS